MEKTVDVKDAVFQLVAFKVGREEYSIPITAVQEIIRMPEITKVPRTLDFVEGVINLRGRVIPVVDLRKRFGLASAERNGETRIIVVDNSGRVVGFMVDAVTEVLRLPSSTVEPAPSLVGGIDSEYIEGVGKIDGRLVILLGIDKVLSMSEKAAMNGMPTLASDVPAGPAIVHA